MIEIIVNSKVSDVSKKIVDLLETGPLQTKVLAATSKTSDLMGLLVQKLPSIVILHVGLNEKPDLETLHKITYAYLGLPVLAVGSGFDDYMIAQIVKAGAMGYLKEKQLDTHLAAAVDSLVSRKDNFITKSVSDILEVDIHKINLIARQHKLSPKEMMVMKMIGSGLDMKEIAEKLSVSVRTVYTYRSRLMEKMDLHSNIAIRHYVLDQHLLENE